MQAKSMKKFRNFICRFIIFINTKFYAGRVTRDILTTDTESF